MILAPSRAADAVVDAAAIAMVAAIVATNAVVANGLFLILKRSGKNQGVFCLSGLKYNRVSSLLAVYADELIA
ncbi:MAG: hypothetical protein Kow0080_34330 [Candidatus Promineifilaceae bacterium]